MKKAFVIQPVGPEGSDIRKRADRILKSVIEPACARTGYVPERANDLQTKTIAEPIISALNMSPLVIADLSAPPWNPNVLMEVGFRLATGRPIIFLADVDPKPNIIPLHLRNVRIHTINSSEPTEEDVSDLCESIVKYGANVHYWESDYPTIEFLLAPQSPDGGRVIFANEKMAKIYRLESPDALIGRPLNDVDPLLQDFIPSTHLAAFNMEQERLVGSIYFRKDGAKTATIPLWFPNHPDREIRDRIYWPVLAQYRFAPEEDQGIVMRVIYADITDWDAMAPPPRKPVGVLRIPELFRNKLSSPSYDIFLSYNSADAVYVKELHEVLKDYGLKVWFDDDDLVGGGGLTRELLTRVSESRLLVVVLGRNGLGRWQADVELQTCLLAHCQGRKPLLLLLLPELKNVENWANVVPPVFSGVIRDIPYIQLPDAARLKDIRDPDRTSSFVVRVLKQMLRFIRDSGDN